MDYTTVSLVKREVRAVDTDDDDLFARFVTAASREADSYCARSQKAVDYFKLETVTGEEIQGKVANDGSIRCWPRKSLINSVTSFQYRARPTQSWYTLDVSNISIVGGMVVGFTYLTRRPTPMFVKISYSGGHGALYSDLPANFVENVTVLAARFYKEAEGGLTDSVGIAELGTLTFTKAMPQRVVAGFQNYRRVTPY